jgi:predicted phosphodiesterase
VAHEEEALTPALLGQVSVAVFGHTHKVVVEKGKVLRLNPGECGGWLSGRCTVAILDTANLEVRIVDL